MSAEPDSAGGYRFSGHAPFVTGWGHIDVVLTAARLGEDVVWAMLDASESASLTARRLELAAVDSSVTVELRYDRHVVPAECVTHVEPYSVWLGKYHAGLRGNGSLPLGVAGRALDLLGPEISTD